MNYNPHCTTWVGKLKYCAADWPNEELSRFFWKHFRGHQSILWGHWYLYYGLLVTFVYYLSAWSILCTRIFVVFNFYKFLLFGKLCYSFPFWCKICEISEVSKRACCQKNLLAVPVTTTYGLSLLVSNVKSFLWSSLSLTNLTNWSSLRNGKCQL